MIALSTAYKEALIAIEINGKKGFKRLDANCKHSENLLPSIDEVLQNLDENLANNNEYAVVIGPGSFTGLRISTAIVKGFMAGDDSKCILPLTTFDLMSYSYIKNFNVQDDFVCVINALSGRYFICKYNAKGERISEEQMVDSEYLSTITLHKVSLVEEGVGDKLVSPSPEELLSLVGVKQKKEKLVSANELAPLYIRKSQAEEFKN